MLVRGGRKSSQFVASLAGALARALMMMSMVFWLYLLLWPWLAGWWCIRSHHAIAFRLIGQLMVTPPDAVGRGTGGQTGMIPGIRPSPNRVTPNKNG